MIILTGKLVDLDEPNLGVMITYNGWWCRPDELGLFAIDNGCFSQPTKFTVEGYLRWLDKWPRTAYFATAPDVVGDAAATWQRSADVLPLIRELGFKAALCAQDGLDLETVQWDAFDCLFIGGTTKYKLSNEARLACQAARSRGKWVHMGRVNSWRRILLAVRFGVDSVDGTLIRFGPTVNLRFIQEWCRKLQMRDPYA